MKIHPEIAIAQHHVKTLQALGMPWKKGEKAPEWVNRGKDGRFSSGGGNSSSASDPEELLEGDDGELADLSPADREQAIGEMLEKGEVKPTPESKAAIKEVIVPLQTPEETAMAQKEWASFLAAGAAIAATVVMGRKYAKGKKAVKGIKKIADDMHEQVKALYVQRNNLDKFFEEAYAPLRHDVGTELDSTMAHPKLKIPRNLLSITHSNIKEAEGLQELGEGLGREKAVLTLLDNKKARDLWEAIQMYDAKTDPEYIKDLRKEFESRRSDLQDALESIRAGFRKEAAEAFEPIDNEIGHLAREVNVRDQQAKEQQLDQQLRLMSMVTSSTIAMAGILAGLSMDAKLKPIDQKRKAIAEKARKANEVSAAGLWDNGDPNWVKRAKDGKFSSGGGGSSSDSEESKPVAELSSQEKKSIGEFVRSGLKGLENLYDKIPLTDGQNVMIAATGLGLAVALSLRSGTTGRDIKKFKSKLRDIEAALKANMAKKGALWIEEDQLWERVDEMSQLPPLAGSHPKAKNELERAHKAYEKFDDALMKQDPSASHLYDEFKALAKTYEQKLKTLREDFNARRRVEMPQLERASDRLSRDFRLQENSIKESSKNQKAQRIAAAHAALIGVVSIRSAVRGQAKTTTNKEKSPVSASRFTHQTELLSEQLYTLAIQIGAAGGWDGSGDPAWVKRAANGQFGSGGGGGASSSSSSSGGGTATAPAPSGPGAKFRDAANKAKTAATNAANQAKSAAGQAKTAAGNAANQAKGAASNAAQSAKGAVSQGYAQGQKAASAGLSEAGKITKEGMAQAQQMAEGIKRKLIEAIDPQTMEELNALQIQSDPKDELKTFAATAAIGGAALAIGMMIVSGNRKKAAQMLREKSDLLEKQAAQALRSRGEAVAQQGAAAAKAAKGKNVAAKQAGAMTDIEDVIGYVEGNVPIEDLELVYGKGISQYAEMWKDPEVYQGLLDKKFAHDKNVMSYNAQTRATMKSMNSSVGGHVAEAAKQGQRAEKAGRLVNDHRANANAAAKKAGKAANQSSQLKMDAAGAATVSAMGLGLYVAALIPPRQQQPR